MTQSPKKAKAASANPVSLELTWPWKETGLRKQYGMQRMPAVSDAFMVNSTGWASLASYQEDPGLLLRQSLAHVHTQTPAVACIRDLTHYTGFA